MNSTKDLTLKDQFKQWLEEEQKTDEMIAFATIPHILRRFDKRLAIIKGNRFEKRYLSEWRKLFRIDKEIFRL
ncbi:tRNA delta(2)-isopentenylpyrophosphate transferase [Rodentibacter trehalosifermentans]|uniref:tRNA delta(2)-isopentenylpyrophosphate transferase n=1 Tax=Rodentibacter trehalosifermentans TaxID=1908263 RepID=UPI0009845100|nr:tRNA delta(2)-isopentenylpyrophosphate transferase [Rodentibacter trehalosifermentans]OOF50380.1 tRNA delta(2)-isopentenylpyrophosphate transferase [Rodentibacter trehalosifermentans]